MLVCVGNDFLNFRFFGCQLGVAEHAFSDRWNTSGRAIVSAAVTIDTLQSKLHVSVVGKCDGLLGRSYRRT